jgi:glucose-6-phosphate dehydrogenase assembly protein OpcA
MAPDVAPALERLIDQYLPVAPDRIEAEFDRIWRETSSAGLDASSVRLRVSNLVAWGLERECSPRFEQVMETLPQRHPCRGILAVLAPDARGTESAISAHCWRGAAGRRHLCAEEILLRSAPGDESPLASAVLALLVPELPVNIWLIGDPDPVRRLPEELSTVADRIIVDSANGAVPALAIEHLAAASRLDAAIEDFTWRRAGVWRELIAQFFDAEVAAAELSRLTRIDIAGGAGSISAAAMLVTGWLIAQLGLTLASVETGSTMSHVTCYAGARAVEVRVTPSRVGAELEMVSIESDAATFAVEHHEESGHLHVRSDLEAQPVHRAVEPGSVDEAAMLAEAMEHTGQAGKAGPFAHALEIARILAGV